MPFLHEWDFTLNLKDTIKEKVRYDSESLIKLKEHGTECTVGIIQICQQADVINCYTMKPALSMFIVELFITSVNSDGFDHLLDKWPFWMYKKSNEWFSKKRLWYVYE